MLPYSTGRAGERVYQAPDLASALEFASRSQQQGHYQFFRGQENSDWLPYPTLARVPDKSREEVKERLDLFVGYAREVSRVAGIEYSSDAILAIAQHYGLPTNFLDLTTDAVVAAMFACPPETVWRTGKAAILLYAQESIDLWCELTRRGDNAPGLELLRFDVSNLWRLQAQRGLFLFLPFDKFCDYYMPDRIVFPHPGDGFVRQGYELYPKSKSPLELQLDLFFDLESTENAKKMVRKELPATWIKPSFSEELVAETTPRLAAASARLTVPWLEEERKLHSELCSNAFGAPERPLRTLPNTYFMPMWKFRQEQLKPHESWFSERARGWLKAPIEVFQPDLAKGNEIVVDLDKFHDAVPCDPWATVTAGVSLEGRPRDRDVMFSFRWTIPPAKPDEENERAQTELLQRISLFADYLWAGLRRTPASLDLIARCIHSLCACAASGLRHPTRWDECYGRKYLEHLKLEYVPLGGHSRTAKVLCTDLAPAVRSDLDDVITVVSPADAPHRPAIAIHLQQMIYPQYLFDFERFADVFIARVLPYEAFVGALMRQTPAGLAINPRAVKIFGLA